VFLLSLYINIYFWKENILFYLLILNKIKINILPQKKSFFSSSCFIYQLPKKETINYFFRNSGKYHLGEEVDLTHFKKWKEFSPCLNWNCLLLFLFSYCKQTSNVALFVVEKCYLVPKRNSWYRRRKKKEKTKSNINLLSFYLYSFYTFYITVIINIRTTTTTKKNITKKKRSRVVIIIF